METPPTVALLDHFAELRDPRREQRRWHKLSDILVIAVCAVLCGAENFPALEDCGHEREDGLTQFLEWPGGIPSPATVNRGFRLLDPLQFQACFPRGRPAGAAATAGEVVALDGTALRRAVDTGRAKRAIPLVSAWATANGVGLGQRKVDTKSHEITAIPELRDLLALTGGLVTIAALGCPRARAQTILARGADEVLALQGKHPTLAAAVARCFVTGPEAEAHRTASADTAQTAQGHGRVETRCAWIREELDAELTAAAWPGRRSLGRVEATRPLDGQSSVEPRCSLSSLPPEAPPFARAVRKHWGIENKLPWTLAVTFREDQSRLRTGHGAENFAVLRHIALNLLRQESSSKRMPRKRLACALNPDYLLKVLLGEQF